jgi:hypothetical protein
MAFRVSAHNFEQDFERWVDALEMAKSLIPSCKGLFQQVKILEDGKLIWAYDRFHRYPQFFGAGTYKRLAHRFLRETVEDDAESTQIEP